MFPVTIRKWSATHGGGTKAYHLLSIETADNKALVVRRFGKVGAWGSLQVIPFSDVGLALKDYDDKRDDKMRGGYHVGATSSSKKADSLEEVKKLIGAQYWTQLGPTNLDFIFPGIDTKGVKEPEELAWEKRPDGSYARKEKDPLKFPEREITDEERRATMPDWGLF